MISISKAHQLKYGTLGAGALGLLLRILMYRTGVDYRNLLISNHWTQIALWILTAAVIAGIFLLRNRIPQPKTDDYPTGKFAAAGCLLAAVALVQSPGISNTGFALESVEPALRYLAALSLLAIAWCRFSRKRPNCLLHCALCLYLTVGMICRYRVWSVEPQLMHYLFQMAAHLTMTFTAYHFAALDAKTGNFRMLWCWGLGSIFFCAASIADAPMLMIGMLCWLCTNLTNPEDANG